MKRVFIETPSFTKKWYALGFNDDDLAELQQFLITNPEAGTLMVGTGGLRKLRYAFKGRGKSGGARVCDVDFASFEKNEVKKVISILKTEAAENWRKENE